MKGTPELATGTVAKILRTDFKPALLLMLPILTYYLLVFINVESGGYQFDTYTSLWLSSYFIYNKKFGYFLLFIVI